MPWQTTAAAIGTSSSALLAATVAIASTKRERAARAERDKLASVQVATERRRPASLVSAWVEERYVPNRDGRTYTRVAAVHIANEGDQPVFDVGAQVGVGFKTRSIGPLAVPSRIPVLPPRRELTWDITLPLLAHRDTESPCAAVIFTDPSGVRWRRSFDGSLIEASRGSGELVETDDEEAAIEQLGILDEPYNPMAVAFAFLSELLDPPDESDLTRIKATLAPEANGWRTLTPQDLARERSRLTDYSAGAMPYYPVPHVAYVKLIHDPEQSLKTMVGEELVITAAFLTLTFAQGRGWRVFGFGRVPVERILFPPGTLGPQAAQLPAPRRLGWRRRPG